MESMSCVSTTALVSHLIQGEVSALEAYERARRTVAPGAVRETLQRILDSHVAGCEELSQFVGARSQRFAKPINSWVQVADALMIHTNARSEKTTLELLISGETRCLTEAQEIAQSEHLHFDQSGLPGTNLKAFFEELVGRQKSHVDQLRCALKQVQNSAL